MQSYHLRCHGDGDEQICITDIVSIFVVGYSWESPPPAAAAAAAAPRLLVKRTVGRQPARSPGLLVKRTVGRQPLAPIHIYIHICVLHQRASEALQYTHACVCGRWPKMIEIVDSSPEVVLSSPPPSPSDSEPEPAPKDKQRKEPQPSFFEPRLDVTVLGLRFCWTQTFFR